MNAEHLTDKLCEYARTRLAAKVTNNMTRFIIGAGTVGAGRNLLHRKVVEMTESATCEGGEIDMHGLKESIYGGFELAENIPVLGGLIHLDRGDANDFFAYIGA